MNKPTILLLLVALVLAAGPAAALRLPDLPGWEPAGAARSFGPDSLWVYIDGAADQFLNFGFRRLDCRDLQSGGTALTLSLYDMGTPLNAFGIYGMEKGGSAETRAIGAETVLSPPYQALMLKQNVFVKLEAAGGGLTAEVAEPLLAAVAAAIPGDDALPAVLDLLPIEGKNCGTEAYSGRSWLGLKELNRCVHAEYVGVDGRTCTVFAVLPAAGQDASAVWTALAAKWTAETRDGVEMLVKEIPYTGKVGVVRKGDAVLGVAEADDDAAFYAWLAGLGAGD